MELYKGKGGAAGLTADKLKGAGIGWTDIFEEIPVSVQNSNLVCALMAQVGGYYCCFCAQQVSDTGGEVACVCHAVLQLDLCCHCASHNIAHLRIGGVLTRESLTGRRRRLPSPSREHMYAMVLHFLAAGFSSWQCCRFKKRGLFPAAGPDDVWLHQPFRSAHALQVSPAGNAAGEGDFQRLDLAMAPPLGRAAEFLSDSLDDVQVGSERLGFKRTGL